MSQEKKKKRLSPHVVCAWVAPWMALSWMGFIFSNSLKTGAESGEQSSRVHETVNEVIHSLGINEEISEGAVRDLAHFIEFFVLGVLVCFSVVSIWRALGGTRFSGLVKYSTLSIPVCVFTAAFDESIQTLSEGRSAEVLDVILDSFGTLMGNVSFVLFAWILWRIKRGIAKRRAL